MKKNINYKYEDIGNGEKIILAYDLPEQEDMFEVIKPGAYFPKVIQTMGGKIIGLEEKSFIQEGIIRFKGGVPEKIFNQIEEYFNPKNMEISKALKIKHKLGVLLHGKQGTGKTTIAKIVMQTLIEKYGAVCIDATKINVSEFLHLVALVRRGNPNCLIAVLFDECEADFHNNERGMLTYLDGNDSVDNHIFIGCTNYLHKIPIRVTNRPSRIRIIEEIKSLPYETYLHFLTQFLSNLPKHNLKIEKIAYDASGTSLTIDELKSVVVTMLMDRIPFKKAVNSIQENYQTEEVEEEEDEDEDY